MQGLVDIQNAHVCYMHKLPHCLADLAADPCTRRPQRILNVEYALPAHAVVTPECGDLLGQILVADPAARISLADVQRHPWFKRDLPPGVADLNDRLLADPQAYRSTATQVLLCALLMYTCCPRCVAVHAYAARLASSK